MKLDKSLGGNKITTRNCIDAIEDFVKGTLRYVVKDDFVRKDWKEVSKETNLVNNIDYNLRTFKNKKINLEVTVVATAKNIVSIKYNDYNFKLDNEHEIIKLSDTPDLEDEELQKLYKSKKLNFGDPEYKFSENQKFNFSIHKDENNEKFAIIFALGTLDNLGGYQMEYPIDLLNSELSIKFRGVSIDNKEFIKNSFYIKGTDKYKIEEIVNFIRDEFKYKTFDIES